MMQEANSVVYKVLKLMQCNRRKLEPSAPGVLKGKNSSAKYKEQKVMNSEKHCDSDNTSTSTEPGDFSSTEFSDVSSHTDWSTGVSGPHQRAPSYTLRSPKPPGLVTTGVLPPPGLAAPSGFEFQRKSALPARVSRQVGKTLNANAMSFVPSTAPASVTQRLQPDVQPNSQQLRHSIKMLKGVLEEWEANLSTASEPQPCQLAAPDGAALIDALAKLTPEQTLTVRSMLDSKLAGCGAQPTSSGRQIARPSQRAFMPFGGCRAPQDQARQTASAPNTAASGPKIEEEESLRTQLRDLAHIDNDRVLMLRKINRLGLESASPLKDHFSQFGTVERVLVAPTKSKSQFGRSQPRVRPAPLGFLVMSKGAEAKAILSFGEEHVIAGHSIAVFPFTSHDI